MATTQSVEVDKPQKEIHIHELTIHDDELIDYLSDVDDGDREDAIVRALKVGATTLQLAETSKDLEHVKREFGSMEQEINSEIDEMQDELQEKFGDDGKLSRIFENHFGDDGSLRQHLEAAFGEDGIFSERLDEELGEDGSRIQDALDPDTEGTPTYRLKQTLKDEIREVADKLTAEEAQEEIRQKTTLKGDDFEEVMQELLEDLVYQTPHSVEYTGETVGELTDSKVGDFIIEVGDTDQRIAIEAKSEKRISTNDIKDQMEEALENRQADYGIFVSECESYLPNKVGYLQEFDRRYVAVSVSENEDDELDQRLFRIGYNWAKMRAAQAALDSSASIDPEEIQSKVDEIHDDINQFQGLKTKCKNIMDNASAIRSGLTDIADDVNAELNAITAELSKAE